MVLRDVRIFPVNVIKRAGGGTTKKPGMSGWQNSTLTRDQITTDNYGAVIPDGVVMLDFDNDEAQPALEAMIGSELPESAIGQWSSRGPHYFFEVPDGVTLRQGSGLLGINGFDTRVSGRGFVCTGMGYRLASEPLETLLAGEQAPLPEKLLELLREPERTNVVPISTQVAEYTDEDVKHAREAIQYLDPNMGNDEWVIVGMALYRVPGGFQIWDEWSQKGDTYDADDIRVRWKSFSKTSVNLPTLFYKAQMNGWPNPKKRSVEGVLDDFDAIEDGGAGGGGGKYLTVNWPDFVFVTGQDCFWQISKAEPISKGALNTAYMRANTWVQSGKQPKRLRPHDYLMDVIGAEFVDHTMYAPQHPEIFTLNGMRYVNTYRPNLAPRANPYWDADPAVGVIERHFMDWFDDEKYGRLVIQWMAHNVQYPGKKILWAPIICGVNGDGKSSINSILKAAMGDVNVRDVGTNEVHSSFNAWAHGACVATLEEVRIIAQNRHEVMNALKPLITNQKISVVAKGQDGKQVLNTCNYIAFTNYPDALKLEGDDRRWVPLYTRFNSYAEMRQVRDDDYWEAFHGAYRDCSESIRGWLLSVDLDGFEPNYPPDTGWHKARMVSEGRTETEKMLADVMYDLGEIFTWEDVRDAGRELGARDWNSTRIGNILRAMGYAKLPKKKYEGKGYWFWCRESDHDAYAEDRHRFHGQVVKYFKEAKEKETEDFQSLDTPF